MLEESTSERTREMKALKMESLGEEDRDRWVSSFGVSFQVKQKNFFQFFLMCEGSPGCQPFVKCPWFPGEFSGCYSGEIYDIGKVQFYK